MFALLVTDSSRCQSFVERDKSVTRNVYFSLIALVKEWYGMVLTVDLTLHCKDLGIVDKTPSSAAPKKAHWCLAEWGDKMGKRVKKALSAFGHYSNKAVSSPLRQNPQNPFSHSCAGRSTQKETISPSLFGSTLSLKLALFMVRSPVCSVTYTL